MAQTQNINRSTRFVLIGVFIAIFSYVLTPILIWLFSFLEFLVPLNVAIGTMLATFAGYALQECIRGSKLVLRNKLIAAVLALTTVVIANILFQMWVRYSLTQQIQEIMSR
ncbi:MAG TPA: hypothetical protein VFO38_04595 [Candidatus Saccharimonadales bacterium]|nr:hypothetical protein [Candidatus Saccharimonadales bacterium]